MLPCMAALKLLLVLALIVYGIKRKIFVGYLLLGAGVITPVIFGYDLTDTFSGVWRTFASVEFWHLFAVLVVVTVLGNLLREVGALDRLAAAAQELAGGRKTATAILPAAVGLMPMPGGAVLSAPLIEEVLKEENRSPQFMSAANYWFRHIMEFFWPLYPGVILAAGIAGVPMRIFSLLGMVMTAAMLFIGYLFFLRPLTNHQRQAHNLRALGRIGLILWPLFLAVFLALALRLDMVIALVAALGTMILLQKIAARTVWTVIKGGITIRLFFLVFGILVFKNLLELSGAAAAIPAEVSRLGIPSAVVIFLAAFLTGLLSGMAAAFVGLSFPVLAGFLYYPDVNLSNLFLAYFSGYLGMILSPTHFCLLLTAEHFKAELGGVYKTLFVPLVLLGCFGWGLYLLGYPWNIL